MPTIGWVLAAAMFALTSALGIVLTYHWFRYAMNAAVTTIALLVYVGVSVFLLLGMMTSLTFFLATV